MLKLPVARVSSIANTLTYLKSWGIPQIAASEKTDQTMDRSSIQEMSSWALWMGNEDKGLSRERLALMDHVWRIKMKGNMDSLNVSVAAGILLHELSR